MVRALSSIALQEKMPIESEEDGFQRTEFDGASWYQNGFENDRISFYNVHLRKLSKNIRKTRLLKKLKYARKNRRR